MGCVTIFSSKASLIQRSNCQRMTELHTAKAQVLPDLGREGVRGNGIVYPAIQTEMATFDRLYGVVERLAAEEERVREIRQPLQDGLTTKARRTRIGRHMLKET
jgi:hypothetical protein